MRRMAVINPRMNANSTRIVAVCQPIMLHLLRLAAWRPEGPRQAGAGKLPYPRSG